MINEKQLIKGKKYRVVAEGYVLVAISNQKLKEEIEKLGFTQVIVSGTPVKKEAVGIWPNEDTLKQFPKMVAAVIKKIEEV